jgi:SpoVK/Ycf46/Vps4 family AAA+-type ATPase
MRLCAAAGVTPPQLHGRPPCRARHLSRCRSSGSEGAYLLREDDFLLSQASGVTEELFKGDVLGVDADVADVGYRTRGSSLAWLTDTDLEAPERLVDAIAVHVAKNLLGVPGTPLILAVWGPKGGGKTLGVQLACARLGLHFYALAASDLEDSVAGEPGLRLRTRYAAATASSRVSGNASVLLVDDLDTGIGRYAHTDRTVNAQTVAASLMALCDAPCMPGRVPIIVTAADVSTLYAPLLRDGRMSKFLWWPNESEMRVIVQRVLAVDDTHTVHDLLTAFPDRSPAFFGALLSRLWDSSLQDWIHTHGGPTSCGPALTAALTDPDGESIVLPQAPAMGMNELIAAGQALEAEDQWMAATRLSREYLRWSSEEDNNVGAPAAWKAPEPEKAAQAVQAAERAAQALREANEQVARAADEMYAASQARARAEAEAAMVHVVAEEQAPAAAANAWKQLSAVEVKAMMDAGTAVLIDIRSSKDFDRSSVKGAKSVPCYQQRGTSLAPTFVAVPTFHTDLAAKVPPKAGVLRVLMAAPPGGHPASDVTVAALAALASGELGTDGWAEMAGGYDGWTAKFTSMGVPRQTGAYPRTEFDFWTASN